MTIQEIHFDFTWGETMLVRALLFTGLAVLALQPAMAETFHRTVNAGRAVAVGYLAIYNSATCRKMAVPRPALGAKPKSGTVTFRKESWTIDDAGSRCKGKPVTGIAIVYTPKPGFRGSDEFRVDSRYYAYDGGSTWAVDSQKFVVTVK